MYRWYGLDDVPADWGPSRREIGVFDGVHLGHQRVVGGRVEIARERDLTSRRHLRPAPGGGAPPGRTRPP